MDDKKKLETLRHSTSHVLAQVVKELYKDVKLGIGPAIEDGFYYDFDCKETFNPEDLKKIEHRMKEIIRKNEKFEKIILSEKEAKNILKNEPYKLELLKELEEKPTFYKSGNFIDLCKGPHINSTGEIKAFKLTKVAGAYWKGDSKNKQLQRIYGTAFFTEKELKEYLHLLEEAEKRDHRKIGKQLDLFSFHDEGPGFPFWHYKGMIIRNELINFWREEHRKRNYKEIQTPMILNKELWLQSGHWDHYKENMYFTKIDNKDFAVKPMNCPGAMLIYKENVHSYKEFPLRVAELGLVHRHELSGVISGLFRVRCFTQDDAHIFMTPEQAESEITKLIEFIDFVYKVFGFDYHVELSTRPEKSIGTKEQWETAEKALKKALNSKKIKYKLNEGEGAFYGPKIDFHIKDCLGRTWQCATIQLDMAMPERFDLTYMDKDGKLRRPVMIHRVILGSIERFIGVLTEHYAGKFPLWLNPVQVRILTVADRFNDYAEKVAKKYFDDGFRVEVDSRTESISKKVREAQLDKVNYILVVGEKEIKDNTVTIRTRDNKVIGAKKIEEFLEQLKDEIKNKK